MKIVVNNDRPTCEVAGCCNTAQNVTGGENPKFRKAVWVREENNVENGWVCSACHSARIAKNRGVKNIGEVIARNAGFDSLYEYQKQQALDAGWESYTDYTNSKHPYLRYRKTFCENVDGRLGFVCTYTPPTREQLSVLPNIEETFKGWLQVDHKDGNHTNNTEENLQTLCACCHTVKTAMSKDYATPGRKTRKDTLTVVKSVAFA